jgi:Zn-dependent metalloprotease
MMHTRFLLFVSFSYLIAICATQHTSATESSTFASTSSSASSASTAFQNPKQSSQSQTKSQTQPTSPKQQQQQPNQQQQQQQQQSQKSKDSLQENIEYHLTAAKVRQRKWSGPNRAAVLRIYEGFRRENLRTIVDLSSPQVVLDFSSWPDNVPWSGVWSGQQQQIDFYSRILGAVSFSHYEPAVVSEDESKTTPMLEYRKLIDYRRIHKRKFFTYIHSSLLFHLTQI